MKTLNLSPEQMQEEISALKSKLEAYEAEEPSNSSSILIGDEQSLAIQYFLLSTHSPDPVFLSRVDNFQFVMVNDRAREIYGYTEKEFLSMSIFDIEVLPPITEDVRALYESTTIGQIMEVTGRNKRKDGSTFPVEVRFSKISDDYALAFVRDVSSRESVISQLQESEEEYRSLYDNMPIAYITADNGSNITSVNSRAQELLGYSAHELLAMKVGEIYSDGPSGKPKAKQIIEQVLQGKKVSGEEMELVRSDGQLRWASLSVEQAPDNSGRRAMLEDITARKEAEAALKKSYDDLEEKVKIRTEELTKVNKDLAAEAKERQAAVEYFSQLLESAPDGMLIVGEDGKIAMMNEQVEILFGYGREELVGETVEKLIPMGKRGGHDALRKGYTSAPDRRDMGAARNLTALRKDGTEFDAEISLSPIKTADGVLTTAAIRDITQRNQMLEEVNRTQKLESLGALAGGLAHDFNNFLTSIMLNIGLAKIHSSSNAKTSVLLESAEKAIVKAEGITKQLLTFSKGGTPVRVVVDVKRLIVEAVEFAIHGGDLAHEIDAPDDLWAVNIDAGQIHQVINNLVINALHAMAADANLIVTLKNYEVDSNNSNSHLVAGSYIEVSVKDNGCGIPADIIESIFDPYFTTRETGTGLGLFSSYNIIERHGGWMKVDTEINVGTIFTIYLPAEGSAVSTDSDRGPEKGSGNVLIMDDDPLIREGLQSFLEGLGYQVTATNDGEAVIDAYSIAIDQRKPFDVVILDLTIPGAMSGIKAMENLINIDPEVCAIVSSGYATNPIVAEYKRHGFQGSLPKPYTVSSLSKIMKKVLEV